MSAHLVKHPDALAYATALYNDSSLDFSTRLSKLYDYYKAHKDLKYLFPTRASPDLFKMDDSILQGCFILEINILKGTRSPRLS